MLNILKTEKIIFLFCGIVNTLFSWITFFCIYPILKTNMSNSWIFFIHFCIVIFFNFINYNIFLYKIKDNFVFRFLKFFTINAMYVPLSVFLFNTMTETLGYHYYFSYPLISLTMVLLTFISNKYFVYNQTGKYCEK